MTWLQIIFVCFAAELVAVTLVFGALLVVSIAINAIEQLFDDEVGSVAPPVGHPVGAEWFRRRGEGEE